MDSTSWMDAVFLVGQFVAFVFLAYGGWLSLTFSSFNGVEQPQPEHDFVPVVHELKTPALFISPLLAGLALALLSHAAIA